MATAPTTATAADLAASLRTQLARKVDAGESLTKGEFDQLQTLLAAESPDRAYVELLADLRQRIAKGRALPKHLAQAARETFLADRDALVWPSVDHAAAELHVSVQTVRNWLGELGVDHQRTAIPKAPVYRRLWERAEQKLDEAKAGGADDDLDRQLKQMRLDKQTGRLVAEAEDRAREGLIAAVTEIRQDLVNALPGRARDALGLELEGEAALRQLLIDAIAAAAQRAADFHTTTATTATTDDDDTTEDSTDD
jgi:hypothetical protein